MKTILWSEMTKGRQYLAALIGLVRQAGGAVRLTAANLEGHEKCVLHMERAPDADALDLFIMPETESKERT